MARTEGGETAGLVASGPTGGAPIGGSNATTKYIGVADDHARLENVVQDDFDRPLRRAAPGVIVGGRRETVAHRPQYSQATFNAMLANTPPEEVWLIQQKLARGGFIGPKTRITRGVWDRTTKEKLRELMELANTYAVDLDTALDMAMSSGEAQMGEDGSLVDVAGLLGEREAPFTGTKRQKDKTVDLTDPQSARTRLRRALREELGRAPRPDEMSAFVAALNASEQSNPVVTDSATSYVDGDATGTTSTRMGGVSPEAFTEEYVLGDPQLGAERNSFKRDTDYYNAAMSVLGEGGGAL